MEEIICDADQSYLLKKNANEYILSKFGQYKHHSRIKSERNWFKGELENLANPTFYTKSCLLYTSRCV